MGIFDKLGMKDPYAGSGIPLGMRLMLTAQNLDSWMSRRGGSPGNTAMTQLYQDAQARKDKELDYQRGIARSDFEYQRGRNDTLTDEQRAVTREQEKIDAEFKRQVGLATSMANKIADPAARQAALDAIGADPAEAIRMMIGNVDAGVDAAAAATTEANKYAVEQKRFTDSLTGGRSMATPQQQVQGPATEAGQEPVPLMPLARAVNPNPTTSPALELFRKVHHVPGATQDELDYLFTLDKERGDKFVTELQTRQLTLDEQARKDATFGPPGGAATVDSTATAATTTPVQQQQGSSAQGSFPPADYKPSYPVDPSSGYAMRPGTGIVGGEGIMATNPGVLKLQLPKTIVPQDDLPRVTGDTSTPAATPATTVAGTGVEEEKIGNVPISSLANYFSMPGATAAELRPVFTRWSQKGGEEDATKMASAWRAAQTLKNNEFNFPNEARKAMAVQIAKSDKTILDDANMAAKARPFFEGIKEALKTAPQGLNPMAYLADKIPGLSASADFMKSMVERAGPMLRVQNSGSTSDIEHKGMLFAQPGLRKDPAANYIVAQMYVNMSELAQKKADVMRTGYATGDLDKMNADLSALNRTSVLIDPTTGKSLLEKLDPETRKTWEEGMASAKKTVFDDSELGAATQLTPTTEEDQ